MLLAGHMRPVSRAFKAKLPVERSGSQRTGEEVQLAEVVTPPPTQIETAVASVPKHALPATASPLPLIALLGLLALGGALTLRLVQTRGL